MTKPKENVACLNPDNKALLLNLVIHFILFFIVGKIGRDSWELPGLPCDRLVFLFLASGNKKKENIFATEGAFGFLHDEFASSLTRFDSQNLFRYQ